MAGSIQDFTANLQRYRDIARTDRFLVQFSNVPKGLEKYGSKIRNLSYQCEGAELPGRLFQVMQTRTYGVMKKSPYLSDYADLGLTFFCMGAGKTVGAIDGLWERQFFEDWMEAIQPTETYDGSRNSNNSYNFAYKEDYARDITVNHIGIDGFLDYSVTMHEAFPVNIDAQTLNWSDESGLRLHVTFAYSTWTRLTTN